MNSNTKTLESYDSHVREYIDGTPMEVSGHVKDWIDCAFDGVSKDANILEIGSAFGRDAAYIDSLGYIVKCTDASKAFVEVLRSKGYDASELNAITDSLPQDLDCVYANAVLLHFTYDETVKVLAKICASLKIGGKFIFSLKEGDGEEWSEHKLGAPRYFRYWRAADVKTVLTTAGFRDINISNDDGQRETAWLMIIATK